MMERPSADSEEKREPVSDIDIAVVDSLKVLDPKRPIREADVVQTAIDASDRSRTSVSHVAVAKAVSALSRYPSEAV
jgi:hypothetical protein